MALISCLDCGNSISDAAPACLHCGRPLRQEPPQMVPLRITQSPAKLGDARRGRRILLFLAGAAIFFVWFYFHSNDTEVAPAPQQTQGVTAADQAAAAAADAAVAAEQATEAVAPVVPVLVATPSELLQRYNSNEVAADQYFAGHLIRVTAPVLAIDKDITDSVVLHFATGDSFNDFMATLDDSQKTEAAQLHRGQTVTVQCKHMKRIIGSPIGDSCTLE